MGLLRYDLSGTYAATGGLSKEEVASLESRLSAVRDEVLGEDLALLEPGSSVPEAKQPLDSAFFELPEKLLGEYAS